MPLYYYMYRSWQDCCRRGENRSWSPVSVESVDSEYWRLNNAIVYAFIMRLTVEERILRPTFKLNTLCIYIYIYIHTHTYIYIYISYVCITYSICVCVCVCVYIYTYTHTHTHTYLKMSSFQPRQFSTGNKWMR